MSEQDNVQVVQQIYASFGQGDIPAVLDALAEDVDWVWFGPSEIPWAGQHHGREDMKQFFGAIGETVEVEQYEPREFIAGQGDNVVVLGWQRIRVKATGRSWETNWCHVFTLRDGKITHAREYYDTVPIVDAFRGDA